MTDKNKKFSILGMSPSEFALAMIDWTIIGSTFLWMCNDDQHTFYENIMEVSKAVFRYIFCHMAYYLLDVHKRFGIWKTSEPKSHMVFAMKTVWIVALYKAGYYILARMLQRSEDDMVFDVPFRFTPGQLGPLCVFLAPEQPTMLQNILMSALIFYSLDFWRYWSHRIGHHEFFYRTFPLGHAHHHNQVFINPLTFSVSPLVHIAQWATVIPCAVACFFGWQEASRAAWLLTLFPTLTQHLGCDPLPWLTRINHKYCMGALPWIPLWHSYHHLHIVRSGNYGNSTVLFDYIFGTVTPEVVYHIEHGEPTPLIKKFFANPDLDTTFQKNLDGGRKNRLDFNH